MDLNPRQVAFIASEMERIEDDDGRYPSERKEATRVREQAESVLIE